MAPAGRGRGARSSRGRGRGGRGPFGARRPNFKAARAKEPDTLQGAESIGSEAENTLDEDTLREGSSESEEEQKTAERPYNALLQMLNGSREQKTEHKQRKIQGGVNRGDLRAFNGSQGPLGWDIGSRPSKRRRPSADGVQEELREVLDVDEGIKADTENDTADISVDGGNVGEYLSDGKGEEEEDDADATDPFEAQFSNPDETWLSGKLKTVTENKWRSVKLETVDSTRKIFLSPEGDEASKAPINSIVDVKLKEKLVTQAIVTIPKFNVLEANLAPYIYTYRDILFGGRTPENSQSLRNLASLHVLNHILKTRDRVIKNNARLSRDQDFEARDQGFTRPKILILLPTRQSCVKYINTMMEFLQPEQQENKKRFQDSYSQPLDQWEDKPEDFCELFSGNDDDMFRIGLKITRKTVKYFSQFYASDMILASPLGLRTAMEKSSDSKKAESDQKGPDYDFLSSIEICIVDQADALLMQNWQHTLYIFSHLNLLPKEAHNTDFSRVRTWYLDDHAKHLRQTLIFSAFLTPDLNSLSATHMRSVAGKIKLTPPPYPGAILSLPPMPPTLQIRQAFTRFSSPTHQSDPQTRLSYFTTAVLPSLLKSPTTPTLIFCPTHPLYLSIRNYLSTSPSLSSVSFGSISEYASISEVARARSHFLSGRHSILLYTERAHHFRRYNIRGAKRVVFVGAPENPLFYSEIVGMLGVGSDGGGKGVRTVRVLFSKWDGLKMERVVGTERVAAMMREGKGDTSEFV